MNNKIEDLLNLPTIDDNNDVTEEIVDDNDIDTEESYVPATTETGIKEIVDLDTISAKIDDALPSVRDLTAADADMDKLAKIAMQQFDELMALGMNTDPRFAAEIFSTASSLMGHAITAKKAKVDNKLKIVQLQLQKARLDLQRKKIEDEGGVNPKEGALSRTELLEILTKKDK